MNGLRQLNWLSPETSSAYSDTDVLDSLDQYGDLDLYGDHWQSAHHTHDTHDTHTSLSAEQQLAFEWNKDLLSSSSSLSPSHAFEGQSLATTASVDCLNGDQPLITTDLVHILPNNSVATAKSVKPNHRSSTGKKWSSRKDQSSARQSKPVSAYALFFRDAQSVIKSSNPNASFGDISKVVASNWEALDKAAKNIYKQRADQEKKNYLKSLASSRAKQIAGLLADQSSKFALMSNESNANDTEQQSDANRSQTANNSTANNYNESTQQSANESLNNASLNQSTAAEEPQPIPQQNPESGKQLCIRLGCPNDAIDSLEWDSEYCSSECCVKHCSDVFQAWVEKQQITANNT